MAFDGFNFSGTASPMRFLFSTVLVATWLFIGGCTTTPDVPPDIAALSQGRASDLKSFAGVFQAEGKWLGEMARLQEENRRMNPNLPNAAPDPPYYDLLSIASEAGRDLHSADRFSIETDGNDLLRITAFSAEQLVMSEEFKRGVGFEYRDGVVTLTHRDEKNPPGYLTKRTDVSLSLSTDHDLIVTRRDAGLAGWLIVIVPEKSSESAVFKRKAN